jgi:hypothetical protein
MVIGAMPYALSDTLEDCWLFSKLMARTGSSASSQHFRAMSLDTRSEGFIAFQSCRSFSVHAYATYSKSGNSEYLTYASFLTLYSLLSLLREKAYICSRYQSWSDEDLPLRNLAHLHLTAYFRQQCCNCDRSV